MHPLCGGGAGDACPPVRRGAGRMSRIEGVRGDACPPVMMGAGTHVSHRGGAGTHVSHRGGAGGHASPRLE
jgi:hypothetical protein